MWVFLVTPLTPFKTSELEEFRIEQSQQSEENIQPCQFGMPPSNVTCSSSAGARVLQHKMNGNLTELGTFIAIRHPYHSVPPSTNGIQRSCCQGEFNFELESTAIENGDYSMLIANQSSKLNRDVPGLDPVLLYYTVKGTSAQ